MVKWVRFELYPKINRTLFVKIIRIFVESNFKNETLASYDALGT